ncbi:5-hydroxytryptamine receptor 3A isoform X1 [Oncorhynchus tshawytscha]|uniref:5-hydroxytryptamine receptor 3A isoform X1 n=1 Tax=Oncorhynchus tshawytscha TaxID=74940 RepID=UPI001C3CE160|nr:5-hydroxytryptamine receptor 3A isoform X1 [Oncorhynchus tshawytscha]
MAAKDFSKMESQRWWVSSHQVLFIICCIMVQAPCLRCKIVVNCTNPNTIALLAALENVMKLYSIRPVMNLSTPTNISMYFTLYGILGVEEKAQLLNTYIWLVKEWENEFFSWDPVQCGSANISLPREMFWSPDVVINEFMDENRSPTIPYVYIKHTGKVRDANPVRVVSSCNLDIYTFPFDVQNCTFTFNSYIHRVSDIRIILGKKVEDILKRSISVLSTEGEWELMDIKSRRFNLSAPDQGESNPYDELYFYIVLRRRATLYVVNLLIPSFFLITVDLFSFLLPPQNADRSSFKMSLIFGYSVFLLIVNDLLPVTGSTIPLINVFFAICLALMVASLLETILITNLLVGSSNFRPVPGWVRVLVLRFMGTLVWLPQKSREDKIILNPVARETVCPLVTVERQVQTGEPGKMWAEAGDPALAELRNLSNELQSIRLHVAQHVDGNQISQDWMQVGYILDRLLFGIYCIFITFSFIVILSVWSNYLK